MRILLGVLAALAATGCAAPRAAAPHDAIAARFKYKVPFETGKRESTATDQVEVIGLWGTRPRIEIGGEYLVVGRYTLQSDERGHVFFYMTGNNWDNSGPVMDLQRTEVRRGSGTFVLQHKMAGPGWFHVDLYGEENELADLYFGEGDNLLRAEPSTVRSP